MVKPIKRWQLVENVAAAIERELCRRKNVENVVVQKAMVPQSDDDRPAREVDVYVEYLLAGQRTTLGVDVKDKGKPIDIVMMEGLAKKASKLRLDRYLVVSTSGFAEQAIVEAKLNDVEIATLTEIESGEWMEIGKNLFRQVTLDWVSTEITFPRSKPKPDTQAIPRATVRGAGETEWQPLVDVLNRAVTRGANLPEVMTAPEGTPFRLSVFLRDEIEGFRIDKKNWEVPIVVYLSCVVRTSQVEPNMRETFRNDRDGTRVSASTVDIPGVGEHQITIVERPEPGGKTFGLGIQITPAKPKQTKVEGNR